IVNFRNARDSGGVGDSYEYVTEMYTRLHQFPEAQKYADSALQIAKEMSFKDNMEKSYLVQAELDSATGNYRGAFDSYKRYILYRDSLINEQNIKKIMQSKMQYDFDKKEAVAKATQDKKDALNNAEIKVQKIMRNFSFAGIVAI